MSDFEISDYQIGEEIRKINEMASEMFSKINKEVVEQLVSFVDLTSLNSTDTDEHIIGLCEKVKLLLPFPIDKDLTIFLKSKYDNIRYDCV